MTKDEKIEAFLRGMTTLSHALGIELECSSYGDDEPLDFIEVTPKPGDFYSFNERGRISFGWPSDYYFDYRGNPKFAGRPVEPEHVARLNDFSADIAAETERRDRARKAKEEERAERERIRSIDELRSLGYKVIEPNTKREG